MQRRNFLMGGAACLAPVIVSPAVLGQIADDALVPPGIVTELSRLEELADQNHLSLPIELSGIEPPQTSNTSSLPSVLTRFLLLIEKFSQRPEFSNEQLKISELLAQLSLNDYAMNTRGPAPKFSSVKAEYRKQFDSCIISPAHRVQVEMFTSVLVSNKERYDQLALKTQVPWYFIGIVHGMECTFNFSAHLHNGDPLDRVTTHKPKNRPPDWKPPFSWEASALDALNLLGLLGKSDWSLERMLYRFEGFNGYGYRDYGINSPYLWSFTNIYNKGKYRKDHRFDPELISQQAGAATYLKALADRKLLS